MIGCEVTGIELLEMHHKVANERKEILNKIIGNKTKCSFVHGSILEYESDEKFDLIWMEEAFHHLEPREKVVNELAKNII